MEVEARNRLDTVRSPVAHDWRNIAIALTNSNSGSGSMSEIAFHEKAGRSANLPHCRSLSSLVLQSTSITWERTASRRRPAFSSHLLSTVEQNCNHYPAKSSSVGFWQWLRFFFGSVGRDECPTPGCIVAIAHDLSVRIDGPRNCVHCSGTVERGKRRAFLKESVKATVMADI